MRWDVTTREKGSLLLLSGSRRDKRVYPDDTKENWYIWYFMTTNDTREKV